MISKTYLLSAIMLLSTPLIIPSSNAAIYNPRRIVLPIDEEIQREMINDLLQREYADRYRDYIEKGLAALSKNNMDDMDGLHLSNKRGQTFVRFGKRSQPSVRFGD